MQENFKLEIISPEKIIFSDECISVTFPSYEGDMSILKDHISIITFLRPGILKVQKKDKNFEEFFVREGTVEFFNNNLILLSSTAIKVKDLSKNIIDDLNKDAEKQLAKQDISDHDRYVLNHQLDTLKQMNV